MTEPLIKTADHVSDIEARRVALFAADVGEYLSLPRYRFSVMLKPAEKGAFASIHTVEHRHVAEIFLCKSWMKRSESDRMNAVIHEVCHLLHRDVDFAVKSAQSFTHTHEFNHIWFSYSREIELMVDYLAQFIQNFSTVAEAWERAFSEAEAQLSN